MREWAGGQAVQLFCVQLKLPAFAISTRNGPGDLDHERLRSPRPPPLHVPLPSPLCSQLSPLARERKGDHGVRAANHRDQEVPTAPHLNGRPRRHPCTQHMNRQHCGGAATCVYN